MKFKVNRKAVSFQKEEECPGAKPHKKKHYLLPKGKLWVSQAKLQPKIRNVDLKFYLSEGCDLGLKYLVSRNSTHF